LPFERTKEKIISDFEKDNTYEAFTLLDILSK